MHTDNYGQAIVNSKDICSALYTGQTINFEDLNFDSIKDLEQFNNAVKDNADNISNLKLYQLPGTDLAEFDKKNQNQWFMPNDYCPNLVEILYSLCNTQDQRDRVDIELELFIQHGMYDLLHYLKYLVDFMRERNIVWGVGRGSSVASYVLYLIGIHKIDSIKYELDINEFLK